MKDKEARQDIDWLKKDRIQLGKVTQDVYTEMQSRFKELYDFLGVSRKIIKSTPQHGILVKQGANGEA